MAVIAAFVVNAVLNLALGLLIAQILGPADFGRFALGTAGAVVLNILLFEWLRLSATRFYSARVREAEPWIRALTGPDRLRMPWRDPAAVVFATAAMTAAILPLRGLTPWLALPACIGVGGLVYAALVWRFDIAGLRTAVLARLGRAVPAE